MYSPNRRDGVPRPNVYTGYQDYQFLAKTWSVWAHTDKSKTRGKAHIGSWSGKSHINVDRSPTLAHLTVINMNQALDN
jgi:hypothetical protein